MTMIWCKIIDINRNAVIKTNLQQISNYLLGFQPSITPCIDVGEVGYKKLQSTNKMHPRLYSEPEVRSSFSHVVKVAADFPIVFVDYCTVQHFYFEGCCFMDGGVVKHYNGTIRLQVFNLAFVGCPLLLNQVLVLFILRQYLQFILAEKLTTLSL